MKTLKVDCNENKIPIMKKVQNKRNIETWEACRDLCTSNANCEFFKWKVYIDKDSVAVEIW